MPLSRPPAVLCVDDEPNALIVRKLLLQHAGYTVFAALNSEIALRLFQDNQVDLVISDHLLRGESGTELARQLKLLKPDLPIMLLSGSFAPPDRAEMADAFIVKGDDPSLLLAQVASVLRGRSQAGDLQAQSRDLRSHVRHFRRGDHICFSYDNKAEQLKAVVWWIQAGLKRGEKCRYFADHNTIAEVSQELEAAGLQVKRECDRGALAFATKHDAYLRSGRFEPNAMIDLLQQDVQDSAKEGFRRYRVSGEMTWSLGAEPGCDRLLEYESTLDDFFHKTGALGFCQYSRNHFSTSQQKEVAAVHHLGLSKGDNSNRWSLRVRKKGFYADVLQDPEEQHCQYCIQRDGSTDVLDLGTGANLKEARKNVEALLRTWAA